MKENLKESNLRWGILAMLFFATTINYMDRIILSVLLPDIRRELVISDKTFGFLTAVLQGAYTIGFLFMGKFVDRFGSRIAYSIATAGWSAAAGLHILAVSAFQLGIWRAFLGFAEACNFPAAIKSVSEWFGDSDRAFATGVFNAGSNVSAVVGPPLFVFLSAKYGWRSAFVLTASLGFVWVVAWLLIHPKRTEVERNTQAADNFPWMEAIGMNDTWGFALAKFFSDPVWWFYMFWLPLYLHDVRKLDMKQVGWALPFIYVMASVGSVAGGWLSGRLIRRGWEPLRARKAVMLLFACIMPVAALGVLAPSVTVSILLFSIATASHQGWSANLFTTVSDVFPKKAVGSVTGFGGFAGGIGGIIFSAIIPGYVITAFGYRPVFLSMGGFYFLGLWALHVLMRKPTPAT